MSACPCRACEGRPAGWRLGGSREQGGVTSHSQQRTPQRGWSSPLRPPSPGSPCPFCTQGGSVVGVILTPSSQTSWSEKDSKIKMKHNWGVVG